MAGLTLVTSLAIGAIVVANSTWLDVEGVVVSGTVRADQRQIITASGIQIGAPLVEVDLEGAVAAVEAVPWVASADVDRDWRGTVTIRVVERQGVVALPAGPRYAIVDETGYQLEVVPERPANFVPVGGIEASGVPGQPLPPQGVGVIALVQALTPNVAAATEQVMIDHDGQLAIALTTGGQALFGDERELEAKLVTLETMLAMVDLSCIDSIDLRVPDAPTVSRLATGTTTQEPSGGAGGC